MKCLFKLPQPEAISSCFETEFLKVPQLGTLFKNVNSIWNESNREWVRASKKLAQTVSLFSCVLMKFYKLNHHFVTHFTSTHVHSLLARATTINPFALLGPIVKHFSGFAILFCLLRIKVDKFCWKANGKKC